MPLHRRQAVVVVRRQRHTDDAALEPVDVDREVGRGIGLGGIGLGASGLAASGLAGVSGFAAASGFFSSGLTSSLSGGKGCFTSFRSAIAKSPVVRLVAKLNSIVEICGA